MAETMHDLASSISNLLPHIEIEDELYHFADGSIAFGIALEGVNDSTIGNEEFNNVHAKLHVLLNSLPETLVYQMYWTRSDRINEIDAYRNENPQSDDPLLKHLVDARLARWREKAWQEQLFENKLYLFGLKRFPKKGGQRSWGRSIQGTFSPKAFSGEYQKQYELAKEEVLRLKEEVFLLLQKQNLRPARVDRHDLTILLWRHLNPDKVLSEPLPGIEYLPEELPGADLLKEWRYFRIGNSYLRVISLKRLPDETYPGLIRSLTDTSIKAALSINFRKAPKDQEITKLQLKRNMADAFRNAKNVKAEIAVQESLQLEKELTAGDESVFHVEWLLTLAASSLEQLDRATQETLAAFRSMNGAEGLAESAANLKLWLSALPGNPGGEGDYRFRALKTSNLADLLPVFLPYSGKGRPIVELETPQHTLARFDPFFRELPNFNSLVFGASGGGKSFLVQYLCMYQLNDNPQLIFIDKGGSYKKFVDLLGGQYFEISGDAQYAINPLDVEPFEEKTAYLAAVIASMVREEGRPLSNNEKIVIEKTLEYCHTQGKLSLSKMVQAFREAPYEIAIYKDIGEQMSRHLERWTNGIYGRLLDTEESRFNIQTDIAAIDLKGLEPYPDLMTIFMLYITELVWSVCQQNPGRRKIIVFDEVWALLATEAGSKLISELYRTLRKYGAGVISVSQGIQDFAAGEYSTGILANVGTIFVLKQSATMNMDRVREILNLSDREAIIAQQLTQVKGEYSEVLVTGAESFVGRVVPTPYEYWIATSDARDRQALAQSMETMPVAEALKHLSDKWPKGVI